MSSGENNFTSPKGMLSKQQLRGLPTPSRKLDIKVTFLVANDYSQIAPAAHKELAFKTCLFLFFRYK